MSYLQEVNDVLEKILEKVPRDVIDIDYPGNQTQLSKKFAEKYNLRYIISGTSRYVYDFNDEYVIKIPHAYTDLIKCNITEYLISKLVPNIPMPETELYFFCGIPVVVMKKLDFNMPVEEKSSVYKVSRKLRRTFNIQDGTGLGKNSDGKLKLYDLGYEDNLLYNSIKKIPRKYLTHMLKKQPDIQIFFDKYAKIT